MKLNLTCKYKTEHLTTYQKTKLVIYGKLHDAGFVDFEFLFSKYLKYGVINMDVFWRDINEN